MTINVLLVSFNSVLDLKEDFLNLPIGFRLIVFDNSTDIEIRKKNQKYCLDHHVIYLTANTNVGLSKAYNQVIQKYLTSNDYLLFLDYDTTIGKDYFELIQKVLTQTQYDVYSPININSKTKKIDSPKLFKDEKVLTSKDTDLTADTYDFFNSINNGLVVKGSIYSKIGLYNESLFVYFVDANFFVNLFRAKIRTKIIPYRNMCDFSLSNPDKKSLKNRLSLIKRDGKIYYSLIYKDHLLLGRMHYCLFFIKKALECSRITKKRYFFSYLSTKKAKI